MTDQPLMVMTNMPDMPAAQALASELVEKRLAACVNIIPGIQSVYRWEGKLETSSEVTLLIKTVGQRYDEVEATIRASHPYTLPEVIALPIARGSVDYLKWVADASRGTGEV